jgi:two-component sensor histidine kinase
MITYTEVTTERVLAEKQKDLLMREINHRVKNNLLMVSSLISLKERSLGDTVDLSDLSRQLDAIRFIHERLTVSENITRIHVNEYIDTLLDTVFPPSYREVQVETEIETEYLPSGTALQIGLIINETATNALKYGFTEDVEPRFSVELKENRTEHEHALVISNSGNSFPDDIPIENPTTLGLRLISALVTQLQGKLELQRRPHPVFTIRFPMEEPG